MANSNTLLSHYPNLRTKHHDLQFSMLVELAPAEAITVVFDAPRLGLFNDTRAARIVQLALRINW